MNNAPKITAEAHLVLACVRCFAGTAGIDAVRESAREIHDWDAVMEVAQAHWIEPLVAWYLKSNCAHLLEPCRLTSLDAILRRCAANYLILCERLRNVLGLFAEHNIPVVPMKGPVLAEMLCDKIPWRESCDLDLLVRRADITRAKDVLVAAGYELDSDLPSGEEKAIFHWRSQLVLMHHVGGPALDLHWQLLPSLFPAARHFDSAWERAQPTTFDNRRIFALSSEDQLFFLCAHAARHCWESLRLAADIARLIHISADLNWDSLIRAARESDGAMVLALGLWMVNRVLDVELPAPVLDYVNGMIEDNGFARPLLERQLAVVPGQYENSSRFWLQFKLAGGWWPKVRCAGAYALLPTDADGQSLRLPPPLFFLYYLYRPARLTLKHGENLLRSLSRKALVSHSRDAVGNERDAKTPSIS